MFTKTPVHSKKTAAKNIGRPKVARSHASASILVVHPKDVTTEFLCPIYGSVANPRIIGRPTGTVADVRERLAQGDRMLALGHGTPMGLLNVNSSTDWFFVDEEMVDVLKNNDEHVYIWCFAGDFVRAHNLKGFYTGMFISEVQEAKFCGLRQVTQAMVDESNDTFSRVVSGALMGGKAEILARVQEVYGKLARTNRVAKYNIERLGAA